MDGGAARHSLAQLQRLAGNQAVQRLMQSSQQPTQPKLATPIVQRFGTGEHLRIGDQGASRSQAQMVTLASDYQLTYGEMIAMAGDFFESLGQMRDLAKIDGTGAGTREEVEYVRAVKVRGLSPNRFSDERQAGGRPPLRTSWP